MSFREDDGFRERRKVRIQRKYLILNSSGFQNSSVTLCRYLPSCDAGSLGRARIFFLRIPRLVSSYRLDLRNPRVQDNYCTPEQTRAPISNFPQPVPSFLYIYKYHLRSYHGSVRRMSVVTLAVWSLPRTALPDNVAAWEDSTAKRVMTLTWSAWSFPCFRWPLPSISSAWSFPLRDEQQDSRETVKARGEMSLQSE